MSALSSRKLSKKERSLFKIIERKDSVSLKRLLDDGVDPNAAEWSSRHGNHTALMYAAGCQFPQGVQMLIEAGADVHAKTVAGAGAGEGTTALHRAIGGTDPKGTDAQGVSDPKQRFRVVELLLDAGADPYAPYDGDTTPLGEAAGSGYLEIVRLILDRGAELDANPPGCIPALHWAAGRHANVVELLLARGAAVDEASKNGTTALIVAANEGADNVLDLLLNHGADVNHRTADGRTPLIAAAQFAQFAVTERQHGVALRIVKRLVEKGADVTARDNDGRTALDWALEANDRSVSDYLQVVINANHPDRSLGGSLPPKKGVAKSKTAKRDKRK